MQTMERDHSLAPPQRGRLWRSAAITSGILNLALAGGMFAMMLKADEDFNKHLLYMQRIVGNVETLAERSDNLAQSTIRYVELMENKTGHDRETRALAAAIKKLGGQIRAERSRNKTQPPLAIFPLLTPAAGFKEDGTPIFK